MAREIEAAQAAALGGGSSRGKGGDLDPESDQRALLAVDQEPAVGDRGVSRWGGTSDGEEGPLLKGRGGYSGPGFMGPPLGGRGLSSSSLSCCGCCTLM